MLSEAALNKESRGLLGPEKYDSRVDEATDGELNGVEETRDPAAARLALEELAMQLLSRGELGRRLSSKS